MTLSPDALKKFTIEVEEPLAAYLGGSPEENRFTLTLLDAARLAGHTCPSVAGAFLISKAAVSALFPETGVCQRGIVQVELSEPKDQGATGPISHIFSYVFGAWDESGFGGMDGEFRRRGLLQYQVSELPQGSYRFTRLDTGARVRVVYHPGRARKIPAELGTWEEQWRHRVREILESSDLVVKMIAEEPLQPQVP